MHLASYLGSSVSLAPDYKLDDQDPVPARDKESFSSSLMSRPALRPIQPPIQWVPGVRPFLRVKLSLQGDAHHSPSPTA
jgi:hypothetical protein